MKNWARQLLIIISYVTLVACGDESPDSIDKTQSLPSDHSSQLVTASEPSFQITVADAPCPLDLHSTDTLVYLIAPRDCAALPTSEVTLAITLKRERIRYSLKFDDWNTSQEVRFVHAGKREVTLLRFGFLAGDSQSQFLAAARWRRAAHQGRARISFGRMAARSGFKRSLGVR
jgi:hypothetical protein